MTESKDGPPGERERAPHHQGPTHTAEINSNPHDTRCAAPSLSARGRVVALRGRYAASEPIRPIGATPDAETVFVGTLIWSSPADAAAVLELVADDDLEQPALSVIVAAIRRLAGAGRPCDAQLVYDELTRAGRIHGGISAALLDATASGAVPEAAVFYAAAVVARSLRRRVGSAGHALSAAAHEATEANLAPIVARATVSVLDCAARLAELRGEE
jgi:acyl-coenzyme A thioesterase PaaI-like protein